jgi:hypothetical protein
MDRTVLIEARTVNTPRSLFDEQMLFPHPFC